MSDRNSGDLQCRCEIEDLWRGGVRFGVYFWGFVFFKSRRLCVVGVRVSLGER